MHSGFQWHTAAIVLAVGLGLISCLFGILVGRCRKRGQFEKEGPRSKAVAQRNLRRRIMRTRGLSNSDMEKNGLLSKLQLWNPLIWVAVSPCIFFTRLVVTTTFHHQRILKQRLPHIYCCYAPCIWLSDFRMFQCNFVFYLSFFIVSCPHICDLTPFYSC